MHSPDQIFVANLVLSSRIGVTDAEQARPQRLTVSLAITPMRGFENLGDQIENTVNYSAVCKAVRALASDRPRRLIETLAEEVAAAILSRFACAAVEVELRKYILPDTDYVAVRIARQQPIHAHET